MPAPDFFDKQWLDKQLLPFPEEFRQVMLEEYVNEADYRKANINIRTAAKSTAKALGENPLLFAPFHKDEDALRNEAEFRSKEAKKRKAKFAKYGIEAVYFALARYVTHLGVNEPKRNDSLVITGVNPLTGLVEQMCDQSWWLRALRKRNIMNTDTAAHHLNLVSKNKQSYICDLSVRIYQEQQKRYRDLLESYQATNEEGYTGTLAEFADLGVSNPKNRKNELNSRMRALEDLSKIHEHIGVMVTMTCPSKFHSALSKSGERNPKWDGSSPKDGQRYLTKTFAQIRAELDRRQIKVYGMRVVEPHHDGTPHWHLLLFVEPSQRNELKEVFRHYCLMEDGDEKGAKENRVDFIDINPEKGSATGYIVKYISKNIDGSDLDSVEDNEDPITNAERIRAWASCYGIRQFQQIGGVNVTAWRELRRIRETGLLPPSIEPIRVAADEGDFAEYTQLMGGVHSKRNEQSIKPFYDVSFDTVTGEIKENRYGVSFVKGLKGISFDDTQFITRSSVNKCTTDLNV